MGTNILDALKLSFGIALTTAAERNLAASCASANGTIHDDTHRARIDSCLENYSSGQIDLKKVGHDFCNNTSIRPGTKQPGSSRLQQLKRSIRIVKKHRKERHKSAVVDYQRSKSAAWRNFKHEISACREALRRTISSLLKVEQETRELARTTYKQQIEKTKQALKQKLEMLEQSLAANRAQIEIEISAQLRDLHASIFELKLKQPLQRIDMSFLSMRKREGADAGFPMFAVFTTKQPQFRIKVGCFKRARSRDIKETFHCSYPRLSKFFTGLAPKLRLAADEFVKAKLGGYRYSRLVECDAEITSNFAGVIPAPVREKIRSAERQFDEILIVTEAPLWQIQVSFYVSPPKVPVGDPLVIGRKGDSYWLIDAFDTTPSESYVRSEFTTHPGRERSN